MNSTASSFMTLLRLLCPGVPPAEAHLAVIEAEESSVGDGNRMGVVADRTLGEVAQPEIFLHGLA
jgi:hypothetical protein